MRRRTMTADVMPQHIIASAAGLIGRAVWLISIDAGSKCVPSYDSRASLQQHRRAQPAATRYRFQHSVSSAW